MHRQFSPIQAVTYPVYWHWTLHSFSLSERHIHVRAVQSGDCDRGTAGVPGVLTDRRSCRRPVVEQLRSFLQAYIWAAGPTQLSLAAEGIS
jgi:hypothetical protein